MSKIPTIIEQNLRSLNPRGIDEDFLSRLTACAEDSMLTLSEEELEFEKSLRALKPGNIPASLRASLSDTIAETPFAVDDKIVLFHKSNGRRTGGSSSRPKILRFNVAAAAAVALLGAIAALMLPAGSGSDDGSVSNRDTGKAGAPMMGSAATSNYAPATFNRNLSDTTDEGVIWRGNNRPHRVLRFTYMDRVTLKNENGETVQVEQPRDEYVIIPEKID